MRGLKGPPGDPGVSGNDDAKERQRTKRYQLIFIMVNNSTKL